MSGGVSRISIHKEIPLNFYTEFKNGSTNTRSNQLVMLIQTSSGPLTPITVGLTFQLEFDDFWATMFYIISLSVTIATRI